MKTVACQAIRGSLIAVSSTWVAVLRRGELISILTQFCKSHDIDDAVQSQMAATDYFPSKKTLSFGSVEKNEPDT